MEAPAGSPPHLSPRKGGAPRGWRRLLEVVSGCLGWRLILLLSFSLLVLLGATSWLALRLHHLQMLSLVERDAVEIGETILSSAHSSMLENDRHHLEQIFANIGQRDRVETLRLLNVQGEIRYSSHPEERGQRLEPLSPSCSRCHPAGASPIADVADELKGVVTHDDGLGLALAVPVYNAPECWEAVCHVHPPDQVLLGILDLQMSADRLEADLTRARQQMAALGLLTIAVTCAVIGLMTWRLVHRPLHEVLDGTRRLARGDLDHRIYGHHGGEVGELASSFNEMVERLQAAQKEREDWNRMLENGIAEKTRELEQARDQMVFAEKMASLGKLSAIVAHEINNPLAGILVSTKLVRRRLAKLHRDGRATGDGQDNIDETLAVMEKETARCGDIVRDLLLFSRQSELKFAPENVNAILQRSMKLVQHQADLQGVAVTLELDHGLPDVICDGAQIEQAFLALIMNAIEAMPDGGTLVLRTLPLPNRRGVRIEVADTGIGIGTSIRRRLFEPFFSTKNETKGTGLGLAVLYGIVKRHGGRVDFTSKQGEGSTFWIELSLRPQESGLRPDPRAKEVQS